MGTSDRTFEQVKSILGKLDRNIDAARARRLHDNSPAPARPSPAPPAAPASHAATSVMTPPVLAAPSNPTPSVPPPSKSGYGRAQPLRRTAPGTI